MKTFCLVTQAGNLCLPLFFLSSLILSFGCSTLESTITSKVTAETFTPVTFPANQSLSFAQDPRLDFGSRGTIEMMFYAEPFQAGTLNSLEEISNPQTDIEDDTLINHVLFAHRERGQTRFVIFLNRNLTRIGMYNGKHLASIPYNFRDRQWHHVAFSTLQGVTSVIIDSVVVGELPIGYGEASNLPLHIGNLDGVSYPFYGQMATLRLWNQPLSENEIAQNRSYGKIFREDEYINSLVGYALFTNERRNFHYTHEVLDWTGAINRGGADLQRWVMPTDARAKKYMVRMDEQMVYAVGVQYEVPESDSFRTKDHWFPYGSVNITDGIVREYEVHPDEGESLTGIAGAFDAGMSIKSMRFITNQRHSELFSTEEKGQIPYLVRVPEGNQFGGFQGEGMDDSEILQSIGLGFKPDTLLPPQDIGLFTHELDGEPFRDDNFVRTNFIDHKDMRDGALHMHGNYTSYPVFHFQHDMRNDRIVVEGELPSGISVDSVTNGAMESTFSASISSSSSSGGVTMGAEAGKSGEKDSVVFHPAVAFGPEVFTYNGNLRYVHENGSVLTMIDAETYHLENRTADSTGESLDFPMRSGLYHRAKPYQQADENKKDPWGATFTMDQRPRLLDFNFRGYNIAKIDPQNYQKGTGAYKNVFQLPTDVSRDYQYTSNGKILPYGIIYRNDREAMQRGRSHTISTEHQHQQAWSINLGLNIGVPGMSFGASGSHSESVQTMQQTQKMNALSIAFEAKHALVIDKTHMTLDPDFSKAIFRLRDMYLSKGAEVFRFDQKFRRDPLSTLVHTYGSHYPYAVTYGGMAYQETALDAKTRQTIRTSSTTYEASASGSLEGATMGGNIGGGTSMSDEVKKAMENSRTHTRTIGGDFSMGGEGGGWSLPDHSEVPVLLDLRPIYELLSPIYFEDTLIWKTLRNGLRENLNQQADLTNWDTESWDKEPAPVRFKVKIHGLENIRAGDGLDDAASEYFGSITLSDGVNDVKAWSVNSEQSGDYTYPFPKSLPNQLAQGFATVFNAIGSLFNPNQDSPPINIMHINFEKTYYVTKEQYCKGNMIITIDMNEEDLPDSQDEYPEVTRTHPWTGFNPNPDNFFYHYNQDPNLPEVNYGGTEFKIYYSLESDPHNWAGTCPVKK